MSFEGTIDTLKTEHQALENAIEKAEKRPQPDEIEIACLKKQKLRIKDEMADMAVA
jgi:hypothetical protein